MDRATLARAVEAMWAIQQRCRRGACILGAAWGSVAAYVDDGSLTGP